MSLELQKRHPVAYEALRIMKYAYRFGVLRGPRIWSQFKFSREPVGVSVPGYGSRIVVRPNTSDVWTFEKIFVSHEYDLSFLEPDPRVILDVGANVGYASLYFSRLYPQARIVALEPQSANFAMLQRNTQSLRNVTAIQAALWPRSTTLQIENPSDAAWAFRVGEAPQAVSAPVRGMTIPEIMAEHQITTIDILKIDIEGAEKEVFAPGCEAWLDKVRILVIELHDWMRDGCGTAFFRATSTLPFRHYSSGENTILARVP